MTARGMVIAVICVFELAIIGVAVTAVGAGHDAYWIGPAYGENSRIAGQLVEGGSHALFEAGEQPRLTVDIGYADLTILTGPSDTIDVSLRPTTSPGLFNATGAIVAHRNGEEVRIVAARANRWSTGDDRMVTVVVPADTMVTVVAAGDMHVDGLRATASLTSVGNGHIDVADVDAPSLHVTTSDGSIVMDRIAAARLYAASSDGRIEGTRLSIRDGSVESDGRVMLGFAEGTDTLVTAETQDGKISTTGFDRNSSIATGNGSDDDESSLVVRIGSGDGHLDVRAGDGNITLANEG